MKKVQSKRSWPATITSAIVGLAITALIISILPLVDLGEVFFFICGALLVVLCALAAIDGKKGAVKDILFSMSFWS